jgi:hypothetical protein
MNENHEMLYSYIELIRIKLNPFYMVLIQTNKITYFH